MNSFKWILTASFLVLGSSGTVHVVRAQCGENDWNCRPPVSSRPSEPSTISVCFKEGEFDNYQTTVGQLQAGIEYWKDWLINKNITSDVTFRMGTSANPCDQGGTDRVLVKLNSALPPSAPGQAGADGTFDFNPSFLTGYSESLINWVGAHEMGHVLGFGPHAAQSCADQTVMVGTYPGSFSLGAVLCADLVGLSDLYDGQSTAGGEEPEPADGTDAAYEDCFYIYNVTYLYWWDSNGNYHEVAIWAEYVGWICNPPI
jgi:hypothetical protein